MNPYAHPATLIARVKPATVVFPGPGAENSSLPNAMSITCSVAPSQMRCSQGNGPTPHRDGSMNFLLPNKLHTSRNVYRTIVEKCTIKSMRPKSSKRKQLSVSGRIHFTLTRLKISGIVGTSIKVIIKHGRRMSRLQKEYQLSRRPKQWLSCMTRYSQ